MDDMQAIEAGTELERRLALYARARLSPDPAATARTKGRVMREARLSFEAARIAAHVAPALVASRDSFRRRMVMPFLAAAVWVGIAVGSISAAQAGGPLFPTRMWVEAAGLPAAPASARTAAELDRLDARIAEAISGVARSDRAAVAAALDAYVQIADEATTQTAGNAGLEALVAAALDQHRAVLTAVAARLSDKDNTTATDAIELNIERAIEHNAAVMVTLSRDGAAPQDGSGGTGGSTGAGGTSGGDTTERTPEPKATPVVDPTHPTGDVDKPDKTPRPDRTPQTEHSPRD
jgi:hypothetical protein